jgi:hypothetical protein
MNEKQKQQISYEAARLLSTRQESQTHSAKLRAARKLFRGRIKSVNMPTDREIQDEVRRLTAATHSTSLTEDDQSEASRDELFAAYQAILIPLESVTPGLERHPEGDVLYHSLQVFELVKAERPWDEELLLAALLHDVGKAVDLRDHVNAGLQVLDGLISERTAWFIEHHVEARGLLNGSIGARARRRFVESDDFEELELFARSDRDGCVPGVVVSDLEDALNFIRHIEHQ